MNDSPGSATPGSSPSDRSHGDEQEQATSDRVPPQKQGPGEPPPNWSARQPPPTSGGTWGVPQPPPPQRGAQAGWGQPGGARPGGPQAGWNGPHAGWQHHPPAAQPGVVPLRPLGVGEILDGAFTTLRKHWRPVLGISLVVAVAVQLVATIADGVWFRDAGDLEELTRNPAPTFDELMRAVSGSLAGSGFAAVVDTFGSVVVTAMLTVVVSHAVLGRPVTIGTAWRDSRPQVLRLLGLLVLVPLLMAAVLFVGALPGLLVLAAGAAAPGSALMVLGLLAGTVAAVWLWVRLSLAAPALMLEKQGVFAAMRRSAKLVRESWWRIFGIQLLTAVLVFIVSSVIQMPATVIGLLVSGDGMSAFTGTAPMTGWPFLIATGIGAAVASTLAFPVRAHVTALLYMDQRIRREALDLELARAAGIPGYGE